MKSERVRELCSLIQTEGDQKKFLELIQELNRLLSDKESHPHAGPKD